MPLFLVSYDLLKPGQDYQSLFTALGNLGGRRVLLSAWVLRGNQTATSLRDYLQAHIDQNDRMLVVQFDNWASYNALININQI